MKKPGLTSAAPQTPGRAAAQPSGQTAPALDQRPVAVAAQRQAQQAISSSLSSAAPIQLSRGSSQANKELQKSMGQAGNFVSKKNMPNAKPHTKRGQGTSGTDHQGRNAYEINTAKQRTIQDTGNATMFQNSQMRTNDERHRQKDAQAEEKRQQKTQSEKVSKEAAIREMFGLEDHEEITKDHRSAYNDMTGEDQ